MFILEHAYQNRFHRHREKSKLPRILDPVCLTWFSARSSYASAVLAIVILSARHTRALGRNYRKYYRYFDTERKGNYSNLLIPTEVGGQYSLPPEIRTVTVYSFLASAAGSSKDFLAVAILPITKSFTDNAIASYSSCVCSSLAAMLRNFFTQFCLKSAGDYPTRI